MGSYPMTEAKGGSPRVTEEIRRSDGDPTRSEILEYLLVESRLSIAAGDTRCARGGTLSRTTAKTCHV